MREDATSLPLAIDWDQAGAECVELLQRMIRVVTVNPPGNELALARLLEEILRADGITSELFEPAPGRGTLVARLSGDGSRRPLLLMAHTDVVGVERTGWTVDPFEGLVRDGYLYGRGAIDDKGMLAANVMAMRLLKRHLLDQGHTLERDVILLAAADEEASGEWGLGWMLEHHADLLDAEYALNEGGRTRVVRGKPLYMAIQTAEKVPHLLTMTARGSGGHAAIPRADNALTRLGRALVAIGLHREPLTLTPTTRAFFAELGRVWPDAAEGDAMRRVTGADADDRERAGELLASIPVLDAVLRNGISPTLVSGGIRANVIPTEATATLNVRTLPGASLDDVVERLRAAVGDPQVTFEVVERGEEAPVSDPDSSLFRAIAAAARTLDPGMAVVPYLSTGATDSARLRRRGMAVYGVLPFPMDQGDEERMHGHDERIPLASLRFGLRVIFDAALAVVAGASRRT